MAKVLEYRTTRKSATSAEKAVSLRADASASAEVEREKGPCCPLDDQEMRKLLKHFGQIIAAQYVQWKRNAE